MLNNFFSIGIPIFNQQLFLDKCLNSILLQDFINYEVIMVDDGSTDESAKICKKYSEKSTRFKYIYQENSGVSAARNTILKKSTGMYLIMIDSDDYIEKGMFKALYEKIMEFKNIELIRFKSEVVNDKPGKDIYRFNYTEEIPSPISGVEALAMWSEESKSKYAVPWLYCVKRELYSGIEFPVGRVHEDFAIYPIILAEHKV